MFKKENLIIIIFIIIIIILLSCCLHILFKRNEVKINVMKEVRYYRCYQKPLTYMLSKIVDNNLWIRDLNNWNLYIPCGYNQVENELRNLKIEQKQIEDNNILYIFAINGSDQIAGKNALWDNLEKYYGRTKASQIIPETWVLNNSLHKKLFYESQSTTNKFIFKKNIQRKEGILLTNEQSTINTLWNSPDEYKIIQKYISDPLLINGYKLNMRIYLYVVVFKNKYKFYLYPDVKCIYTREKYDKNSIDFEKNITSFNLDLSIYQQNPRNFQQLKDYLKKTFNNRNEIENLWENIETMFRDVCKAITKTGSIKRTKNLDREGIIQFQLFGCDVMMDDDLKPYLLEINKGPDMSPKDEENE